MSIRICGDFFVIWLIEWSGGDRMCRRNHCWGLMLMAFGIGLLVGQCLKTGFWCYAGAVVIMGVGFSVMRQK